MWSCLDTEGLLCSLNIKTLHLQNIGLYIFKPKCQDF